MNLKIRYNGREFELVGESWVRLEGEEEVGDFLLDRVYPMPHEFFSDALKRQLGDDVEILNKVKENLEDAF